MDKEKAAKTLSKELSDKLGLGREAIIEDSYKDNLIKNSLAVYQIGSPVLIDFSEGEFIGQISRRNIIEVLLAYGGSFAEANYYFLKNTQLDTDCYGCNKRSRFAVTPYALIGKKEESSLRKLFYKNVQPEIAYAMSTLEIEDFIDFYKNYKDSSLIYPAAPIVMKVLKEDLEVVEKFIDFATKLKYDDDEEVHRNVFRQFDSLGSLNSRLERLISGTIIKPSRKHPDNYVHREDISNVVKQVLEFMESVKYSKNHDNPLLNEFINFVFFSLPYEEQNIESNKKILKSSSNLNFVAAVLSKEYSNGQHFQAYFEVLGKELQDKVIESLKFLSDKKPVYDSFLWSKGFNDINLDHVDMYKKDANIFIDYFSKRSVQEKKTILKDIMGCDFVNEKVADWLNQNEPDLIREVGLNG